MSLSSVLAEESSIRIEDLEEIPRDLWPDLTQPGLQVAPLRGNASNTSMWDIYEPDTLSRQVDREDPLWSPFVVNGETYADHDSKLV